MPWELLHHEGSFLVLDNRFALVRYIQQSTRKVTAIEAPQPVRVLFVAANPQGCNQLELEQEYRNLQEKLRNAEISGIIELEPLFHATLSALHAKLAESAYHMLHFAGHASHEGYLLFEDNKHQSKQVSAEDLAPQLQNHRSLALVVLNACESGRASDSNW